jgi:hypothetical protein
VARGGRAPKRKGDEFEREICRLLNAERTYWQPGQEKKPDCINAPYLGAGECKRRRNSFSRLYKWLENVDFLAIRDDRKPALIVMRAKDIKLILEEMDELKSNSKLLSDAVNILHMLEQICDLVKWTVEVREHDPLLTDIATKLDNVIAELDSAVRDSEIKTKEDSP